MEGEFTGAGAQTMGAADVAGQQSGQEAAAQAQVQQQVVQVFHDGFQLWCSLFQCAPLLPVQALLVQHLECFQQVLVVQIEQFQ